MAKLTNEQVRHVAKLARLSLTDDEVDLFATQLGDILEYVKKLDEVDTARVTPLSHPHEQTNVLREDEPTGSLSQEQALVNAPAQSNGCFQVPKVIGGGA